MKKRDTDLWLVKNKSGGCKIKVTTRCLPATSTVTTYNLEPPIITLPQPPTPTDHEPTTVRFELGAGVETTSNIKHHIPHHILPETATQIDNSGNLGHSNNHQNSSTNDSGIDINQTTSPDTAATVDQQPTDYVRNKSTTRSWPVIHRNNSYRYQLQPTVHNHRRQQSHQYYQYDYDALTGPNCPSNDTNNNINYSANEDYLVSSSYDKSPSIDSYYFQHYRHSMQQSTTTMTTAAGQGGATITSTAHHQTQSGTTCCMMPPPVLFLFFTLLMTSSATAMLCAAIMTDHWEHVSWNRENLDRLSNKSSIELQWYLDGRAAKFSVSDMHRRSGDGRSRGK